MNYYTVKLTTKGGTVYTYDSISASSPDDAASIVCATWQGQPPCTPVDLRQVTENHWEGTSPEGILIQVWPYLKN